MDEIDQRIAWKQEKTRRRAAWEEERKAAADRREREEKQARLETHLRRREESWTEHTGTPPQSGMLTRWTEEYVDEVAAAEARDLELRRARAAAESGW